MNSRNRRRSVVSVRNGMRRRFVRWWRVRLGIRTQMTLWYTLVFAVLLALFSAVFFLGFQQSLYSSFDTTLQLRAQQIAGGISQENGVISIQDITGSLPGLITSNTQNNQGASQDSGGAPSGENNTQSTAGADVGASAEVTFGALVRILDAHGHTVYRSPGFTVLTVPATSVANPLRGTVWRGAVSSRDGQQVRLYSAPLTENGQTFGVVQVAAPLASLTATLRSAALALALLAPFILMLGALGGYWLAAQALRPAHRLTSAARLIEASDLRRRVPVPIARDEIYELSVTFNAMIARLEQSFERERRFVADASHELRTPIAAIRTMTETTLEEDAPQMDECLATLGAVNAEAERLGQLVADLLALARSDEGQRRMDHVPVRLDQIALDAAAVAEPLADERRITVAVNAATPVTVEGDEARLIQVVMNLLDNAIRYTPPDGRVVVSVSAERGQALLTVRDTGNGIAPEHLPHIFERFYRADPARSRADGGSGLGLAIVEQVVEAHHGTISAESQVGRGSLFEVRLPLAADARLLPGAPSPKVYPTP